MIEEKDSLLLSHLQKGLPFVSRPFAVLGTKTGLGMAEVLLRVEKLRTEGRINGIRAFWGHRPFGYQSVWAAMRFPKGELAGKAAILGGHPGVIYIAERDHALGLWFFLSVPPGHNPEAHVRILEKLTNPEAAVFLPLRELLKGTSLLHALAPQVYEQTFELFETNRGPDPGRFSFDEIRLVRALQDGFPVTDEPFRKLAEMAGVSEKQTLELLNGLLRKGHLKRIGAELPKKSAAREAETLVAWQIPGEKIEKVADFFEGVPEIVHADLRPGYPEFPFTVHTLILSKHEAELEVLVRRIEDGIGKWPHQTVPLVREIKKMPMRYFPKNLDGWWVKHRALADTAFDRLPA